jgi:hypothetical protein
MKNIDANRALLVYSAILTGAVAWSLLSGAASATHARFDVIDVHRINLREADGTLRMVLASRDRFPGVLWHGQEKPHPDRGDVAGLIFMNDEGTENGGLIFSGAKQHGKVDGSGHLSFDQYEQDQVVTLEQTEEDGQRAAGLTIADRPDAPLDFGAVRQLDSLTAEERAKRLQGMRDSGEFGYRRVFVGKTEDHDSLIALRDAKGRVRLRLRVTAAGAAAIEFLNEAGDIVKPDGAAGSGPAASH